MKDVALGSNQHVGNSRCIIVLRVLVFVLARFAGMENIKTTCATVVIVLVPTYCAFPAWKVIAFNVGAIIVTTLVL